MWLQELPITVRLLPVGLMLICVFGMFVFMTMRPVDGESVVAETASENRAGIAIGLLLTVVSILPSMILLLVLLSLTVVGLFAARNQLVLRQIELARL